METGSKGPNDERPELEDEGWSAPAADSELPDTLVARRLKQVAAALVIAAIALIVYFLSRRA